MNKRVDPRLLGFSYHVENTTRKPRYYHTAVQVAFVLSRIAAQVEQQAHELEMAIKDVRVASNSEERSLALIDLRAELEKHCPFHAEE